MRPHGYLLLGLLAACGSDSTFADAQVDGAEIADAGGPDADAHGVVTVTVYTQAGGPLPDGNATVVFTDAERTQVVATDAQGKASATVLPGATVTAVRPLADPIRVTTILEVAPGDQLVVGSGLPATTALGTVTLGHPPFAGASRHTVLTGCGDTDTVAGRIQFSATVTVTPRCGRSPYDFLLIARDEGGAVIGSAQVDDQVAPSTEPVVVAADRWRAAQTFDAMYTDIPDTVNRLTLQRTVVHDGKAYVATTVSADRTGVAQPLSVAFPVFEGAEASILTTVQNNADSASQQIRERRPVSTSYGLQVAPALLPWLSGLAIDDAGRRLSWSRAGTGDGDGTIALIGYRLASQQAVTWTVVAPPGATSLELPDLPAGVGIDEPTARGQISAALVGLIDSSKHDGYRAFRQAVEPDLEDSVKLERFRFSITAARLQKVSR